MKKSLFILAFITCGFMVARAQFEGGKQMYSSPKMKSEITTHQKVAILPFETSISYKRPPKNYDSSANRNEEISLARNLQQSMYTYLLRKGDKYFVSFQNVDQTNAKLKAAGVYNKLDEMSQDSICKILGVDAVIKSNYAYEKTSSEGGAIAKTILFGSLGSKTGSGALTMQIFNGNDGELLWRFYKAMDDNVFASTDELMERMMKKVSRNFPYEK